MENTSQELYVRILDQFPNPIWRAGIDSKCNFFNKAWLAFTGRKIEQEMGDGWAEGVHPDDFKNCLDIYVKNFNDRKSFKMKYRLKFHDGTYHWLMDYGNPFYDEKNNFLGFIGSCYDINDDVERQESIEKMNAFMTNREMKMKELKEEVAKLKERLEELTYLQQVHDEK